MLFVSSRVRQFKVLMQQYKWLGDNTKANRAWNAIQGKTLCCGIEKAQEWDEFRPKFISDHLYPSSCCKALDQNSDRLCPEDKAHSRGCKETLAAGRADVVFSLTFSFLLQLALCLIAFIVGNPKLQSCYFGRSAYDFQSNNPRSQLQYRFP